MVNMLDDVEARVLASLVEKSVTTPEYYPLSLNALVNACNQKSNRDPVVSYDSATVGEALNSLKTRGLARILMGGDSRVPKYQHYFEEAYELSPVESAILCELMLRGPQTVGELRGRIERFGQELDLSAVEDALGELMVRTEPLVTRLPRQAGRKENRYAHLLSGEPDITEGEEGATYAAPRREDRVAKLEEEVASLRATVEEMRRELDEFRRQFE